VLAPVFPLVLAGGVAAVVAVPAIASGLAVMPPSILPPEYFKREVCCATLVHA
jgi:hypothetical protein